MSATYTHAKVFRTDDGTLVTEGAIEGTGGGPVHGEFITVRTRQGGVLTYWDRSGHSWQLYNPDPLPRDTEAVFAEFETARAQTPQHQAAFVLALAHVGLIRAGVKATAFSRDELQSHVLALDEALRVSLADRDALCIRAAVRATEDQAEHLLELKAVADAAVKFMDGDISQPELFEVVLPYAEANLGADL